MLSPMMVNKVGKVVRKWFTVDLRIFEELCLY